MKLLSISQDAKTIKGEKQGWLTAIMYLTPAHQAIKEIPDWEPSVIHQALGMNGSTLCPFSTKGCRDVCLYTSGRGRMPPVHKARLERTKFLLTSPSAFLHTLWTELYSFVEVARNRGLRAAVRLNGTSDLAWWRLGRFRDFASCAVFYDYTKRFGPHIGPVKTPWRFTYSLSESPKSHDIARTWLKEGANVAVVYRSRDLVERAIDLGQIDGDANDLRFLDEPGKVVALAAKGKAKRDTSGFVQDTIWQP